jgi:uncharacterized iron-regulated membrane protein
VCPPAPTDPDYLPAVAGGRRRSWRRQALQPVLWRLHFFSGLLSGPVIVWMALPGIAFAWNPQIADVIYHKALTAVSGAPDRPLTQQVRAARATRADYEVTAVVPAAPTAVGGEQTTEVALSPPPPDTNRFQLGRRRSRGGC